VSSSIHLFFCSSVLLFFCSSVLLFFCSSVLLFFCSSTSRRLLAGIASIGDRERC